MFRFTIRDVLWLTLVVGMGAGWLIDRSRLVFQYDAELHEKDVFMHTELEKVERDATAAFEKELTRWIQSSKDEQGQAGPATGNDP